MNTQDEIMKILWDNENAQGIAKLMDEIVMPAIAKMPEDQQIEAMGTVRDTVSDIAEYEECRKHMIETIKGMRETISSAAAYLICRKGLKSIKEMQETISVSAAYLICRKGLK